MNRIFGLLRSPPVTAAADNSIVEPIGYTGPITALSEYLQYYTSLIAPGFAVLVTGAWGVGKTHQVKKVIAESQRYYVSLYGLDSVNAIHNAVLESTLPSAKLSESLAEMGEVAKAMGDKYAIAGLASGAWTMFLRKKLTPERTLIFDDLERSSLWGSKKSELLGAINHYAEHLGFRVIVICYEELVASDLGALKEKTFGHTVRALPQTGEAVERFLGDIPESEIKNFINANLPLIIEVWRQSQQTSLRILKHLISDIARLRRVLSAKHVENEQAMNHLLRFFCALDIEVRAGNIGAEYLVNRRERHVSEYMDRQTSDDVKPFTMIDARYPSADVAGTVLSDEILTSILIDGRFDKDALAFWLDQTPYFIQASNDEPWRIVMHFDEVEDAVLNEGLARMQSQFEGRSVTNMGEFLQIAALRLMLVEQKCANHTLEEEVALCTAYIDDLMRMGTLPAKPLGYNPHYRLDEAYGGYAFWLSTTTQPHFAVISERVENARNLATQAAYPAHAEDVLRRLKEDQDSVFGALSNTNSAQGAYGDIPILVHIPVDQFLDAWFSGPREGWRKISRALEHRYEHGQLSTRLAGERDWLIELNSALDGRIDAASGLSAFRLSRLRPKIFDNISHSISG